MGMQEGKSTDSRSIALSVVSSFVKRKTGRGWLKYLSRGETEGVYEGAPRKLTWRRSRRENSLHYFRECIKKGHRGLLGYT